MLGHFAIGIDGANEQRLRRLVRQSRQVRADRVANATQFMARGTAGLKNCTPVGRGSLECCGLRKLFQDVRPVRRHGWLWFVGFSFRDDSRLGPDSRGDLLNLLRHCLGDGRRAKRRFLDRGKVRQTGTQDRRGQIRVGGITEQQLGQGFAGLGLDRLAKRMGELLANKRVGVTGPLSQAFDPIRITGCQAFPQPDGVPPNRRVSIVQRRHNIALGQAAQLRQRRHGLNACLRLTAGTNQAPQTGNSRLVR